MDEEWPLKTQVLRLAAHAPDCYLKRRVRELWVATPSVIAAAEAAKEHDERHSSVLCLERMLLDQWLEQHSAAAAAASAVVARSMIGEMQHAQQRHVFWQNGFSLPDRHHLYSRLLVTNDILDQNMCAETLHELQRSGSSSNSKRYAEIHETFRKLSILEQTAAAVVVDEIDAPLQPAAELMEISSGSDDDDMAGPMDTAAAAAATEPASALRYTAASTEERRGSALEDAENQWRTGDFLTLVANTAMTAYNARVAEHLGQSGGSDTPLHLNRTLFVPSEQFLSLAGHHRRHDTKQFERQVRRTMAQLQRQQPDLVPFAQRLMVPVCENDSHWTLSVAALPLRSVVLYNTQGFAGAKHVPDETQHIVEALAQELLRLKYEHVRSSDDAPSDSVVPGSAVWHWYGRRALAQHNTYSCGDLVALQIGMHYHDDAQQLIEASSASPRHLYQRPFRVLYHAELNSWHGKMQALHTQYNTLIRQVQRQPVTAAAAVCHQFPEQRGCPALSAEELEDLSEVRARSQFIDQDNFLSGYEWVTLRRGQQQQQQQPTVAAATFAAVQPRTCIDTPVEAGAVLDMDIRSAEVVAVDPTDSRIRRRHYPNVLYHPEAKLAFVPREKRQSDRGLMWRLAQASPEQSANCHLVLLVNRKHPTQSVLHLRAARDIPPQQPLCVDTRPSHWTLVELPDPSSQRGGPEDAAADVDDTRYNEAVFSAVQIPLLYEALVSTSKPLWQYYGMQQDLLRARPEEDFGMTPWQVRVLQGNTGEARQDVAQYLQGAMTNAASMYERSAQEPRLQAAFLLAYLYWYLELFSFVLVYCQESSSASSEQHSHRGELRYALHGQHQVQRIQQNRAATVEMLGMLVATAVTAVTTFLEQHGAAATATSAAAASLRRLLEQAVAAAAEPPPPPPKDADAPEQKRVRFQAQAAAPVHPLLDPEPFEPERYASRQHTAPMPVTADSAVMSLQVSLYNRDDLHGKRLMHDYMFPHLSSDSARHAREDLKAMRMDLLVYHGGGLVDYADVEAHPDVQEYVQWLPVQMQESDQVQVRLRVPLQDNEFSRRHDSTGAVHTVCFALYARFRPSSEFAYVRRVRIADCNVDMADLYRLSRQPDVNQRALDAMMINASFVEGVTRNTKEMFAMRVQLQSLDGAPDTLEQMPPQSQRSWGDFEKRWKGDIEDWFRCYMLKLTGGLVKPTKPQLRSMHVPLYPTRAIPLSMPACVLTQREPRCDTRSHRFVEHVLQMQLQAWDMGASDLAALLRPQLLEQGTRYHPEFFPGMVQVAYLLLRPSLQCDYLNDEVDGVISESFKMGALTGEDDCEGLAWLAACEMYKRVQLWRPSSPQVAKSPLATALRLVQQALEHYVPVLVTGGATNSAMVAQSHHTPGMNPHEQDLVCHIYGVLVPVVQFAAMRGRQDRQELEQAFGHLRPWDFEVRRQDLRVSEKMPVVLLEGTNDTYPTLLPMHEFGRDAAEHPDLQGHIPTQSELFEAFKEQHNRVADLMMNNRTLAHIGHVPILQMNLKRKVQPFCRDDFYDGAVGAWPVLPSRFAVPIAAAPGHEQLHRNRYEQFLHFFGMPRNTDADDVMAAAAAGGGGGEPSYELDLLWTYDHPTRHQSDEEQFAEAAGSDASMMPVEWAHMSEAQLRHVFRETETLFGLDLEQLFRQHPNIALDPLVTVSRGMHDYSEVMLSYEPPLLSYLDPKQRRAQIHFAALDRPQQQYAASSAAHLQPGSEQYRQTVHPGYLDLTRFYVPPFVQLSVNRSEKLRPEHQQQLQQHCRQHQMQMRYSGQWLNAYMHFVVVKLYYGHTLEPKAMAEYKHSRVQHRRAKD